MTHILHSLAIAGVKLLSGMFVVGLFGFMVASVLTFWDDF